jgi:hypothetical protein
MSDTEQSKMKRETEEDEKASALGSTCSDSGRKKERPGEVGHGRPRQQGERLAEATLSSLYMLI